jgi:hypothetical protein
MAVDADPPADPVLTHVCEQLAFEFGDQFPEDVIHDCVLETFDEFSQARVQTYVPLLLHRSAQARLRTAASRQAAQGQRLNHAPNDLEVAS